MKGHSANSASTTKITQVLHRVQIASGLPDVSYLDRPALAALTRVADLVA
jgi:hypothetical protein